jgi:hypothetical protein
MAETDQSQEVDNMSKSEAKLREACKALRDVLSIWRNGQAGERPDIWQVTEAAEKLADEAMALPVKSPAKRKKKPIKRDNQTAGWIRVIRGTK